MLQVSYHLITRSFSSWAPQIEAFLHEYRNLNIPFHKNSDLQRCLQRHLLIIFRAEITQERGTKIKAEQPSCKKNNSKKDHRISDFSCNSNQTSGAHESQNQLFHYPALHHQHINQRDNHDNSTFSHKQPTPLFSSSYTLN